MTSSLEAIQLPHPRRIGRYQILAELGRGGMGAIFLGRAMGLGGFERLMGLKVIHDHLAREKPFVDMFLDEARIAARIRHPNVVSVYEVGIDEGRYFLAMDYVRGESLSFILSRAKRAEQPPPIGLMAHLVANACDGLHAAHELRDSAGRLLQVVHRDISPSNLMIGYDGLLRVMDFGVAKAVDQLGQTRPGVQKGKFAYMAPEQLRAQPIDRRTDVFALGVTLWEATIGRRLFRAETDVLTAARVLSGEVLSPRSIRPEYPAALEEIVTQALSQDPDRRYQTARDMARAIRTCLVEEKIVVSNDDIDQFMRQSFPQRLEKRLALETLAASPGADDFTLPTPPPATPLTSTASVALVAHPSMSLAPPIAAQSPAPSSNGEALLSGDLDTIDTGTGTGTSAPDAATNAATLLDVLGAQLTDGPHQDFGPPDEAPRHRPFAALANEAFAKGHVDDAATARALPEVSVDRESARHAISLPSELSEEPSYGLDSSAAFQTWASGDSALDRASQEALGSRHGRKAAAVGLFIMIAVVVAKIAASLFEPPADQVARPTTPAQAESAQAEPAQAEPARAPAPELMPPAAIKPTLTESVVIDNKPREEKRTGPARKGVLGDKKAQSETKAPSPEPAPPAQAPTPTAETEPAGVTKRSPDVATEQPTHPSTETPPIDQQPTPALVDGKEL